MQADGIAPTTPLAETWQHSRLCSVGWIQYAGCARVRVARCEVQQQCNKATTVEKAKGGNSEGEYTRVYMGVRESAKRQTQTQTQRERERERA